MLKVFFILSTLSLFTHTAYSDPIYAGKAKVSKIFISVHPTLGPHYQIRTTPPLGGGCTNPNRVFIDPATNPLAKEMADGLKMAMVADLNVELILDGCFNDGGKVIQVNLLNE